MQSRLQFFIFVFCLASCILSANLPRLESQPSPGKSFYTIFPKNNTDTSKTGDFVKQIVGTEDLLPWTSVSEQLISWTVEASPEEVSKLQENTDIDRVTEFHPSKMAREELSTSATDTPTYGDLAAVE
jgi:hypothetical protein